ncbi:MAG: ribonuclease R [Alphaproteobacteria bacterium]|nr:ribonuclease R [Alphaproteobacteria bacterium]
MSPAKKAVPFPEKGDVLRFILESPTPVGKREIARAFHIRGDERVRLKALLKELEDEGVLEKGDRSRLGKPGQLPEVTVIEVVSVDHDGYAKAKPATWDGDGDPPLITIPPAALKGPAPAEGERILARLAKTGEDRYRAKPMRRLGGSTTRLLGLLEKVRGGWRLRPVDKRSKKEFQINDEDRGDANDGDIVIAEPMRLTRMGLPHARVVDVLGHSGHTRAISLVAIHEQGIPTEFPEEALRQAKDAKPVELGKRTDLRDIPLVTIDGLDARDFDDAVFAEPDPDPKNEGGFRLIVAIADVAHYVRPDSPLDRSARERGNSVYLPDHVVPMLPEALSNDLCSLRPHEDRACMAVEIVVDAKGKKLGHKFMRGLMRSHARLTYEQVEQARLGEPDDLTEPLLETVIQPLVDAYRVLELARHRRGTLDLDIAEQKVEIDTDGNIVGVRTRERLLSHQLIEEFMVLANVCAAETLEAVKRPCMYRIHDEPAEEKVVAFREVVEGLGYSFPKGQVAKPRNFTQIIEKAKGTPEEPLVNDLALRSQAQAVYAPDNIGHFGLALPRYAHFTSPIRRYADLLVHRALISGCGLGPGGLPDGEGQHFDDIGEHISMTERRAATAERSAVDRFVAAYMESRAGEVFQGRIAGVATAGIFVKLAETGADGLVPMRLLPPDYYEVDRDRHRLVGQATGQILQLGDPVEVKLLAADRVTGGMLLELVDYPDHGTDGPALTKRPRKGHKAPKTVGRTKRKLAKKTGSKAGRKKP